MGDDIINYTKTIIKKHKNSSNEKEQISFYKSGLLAEIRMA